MRKVDYKHYGVIKNQIRERLARHERRGPPNYNRDLDWVTKRYLQRLAAHSASESATQSFDDYRKDCDGRQHNQRHNE